MAEKLPFGEGSSINISPLFCGLNYQLWNVRMKIFVEWIDRENWDAIVNDPFGKRNSPLKCKPCIMSLMVYMFGNNNIMDRKTHITS